MSGSRAKARHTCYYIYIIYIIIYNYERPQRRTLPLPSNCQGMGQPARCIPALRTACSQQVSAYYSLASHPYFSVYAQFRVRAIDRAIARSCDYHAHFFRIRLTVPIARYLAKRFGMAGEDDMAALILDGAVDTVKDLVQKFGATFKEKDEEKKAALKKDLTEYVIPRVLGGLEKLAAANNCVEGWFYGPKVSYADFYFSHFVTYLQGDVPDLLDKYPALKKQNESVTTLPNIAKWDQG